MTTSPACPLCDIDPAHGPMQVEHLYTLDGEIDTRFGLFWFCQIKNCDGYGGPVKKERKAKPPEQIGQLSLFEME